MVSKSRLNKEELEILEQESLSADAQERALAYAREHLPKKVASVKYCEGYIEGWRTAMTVLVHLSIEEANSGVNSTTLMEILEEVDLAHWQSESAGAYSKYREQLHDM